jgi:raffinose/stachyose/melibiose transport system substrate-binding protein
MNAYYPPTAFPSMGASIQKYLGGEIDRDGLTEEIVNYWKNDSK